MTTPAHTEMSEISQEDKLLHAKWVEAVARANTYVQKFPGDGFTHEIDTKGPGGLPIYAIPDIQLPPALVTCPCHNQIFIERPFREPGDCDIIECPTCHYWHVLTWRVAQPSQKKGGHFILPPKKKKA